MTQIELARRARVSRSLLKIIELHGHQPSGKSCYQLAKALDVDLDEFSTATNDAAA